MTRAKRRLSAIDIELSDEKIEYHISRHKNPPDFVSHTVVVFKMKCGKCMGFDSLVTIGLDGVE